MIALHAALLARKTRPAGADDLRPPRGPGRDHQAPPGGDPLPHGDPARRRRSWRRTSIVVMDGGAYATLTPVVLSRGTLHAGGPYDCANVRIRVARRRHQHAAERRVPRLRGAADRVRGGDAGQPGRRGARHVAARAPPPQRVPAGRRDADRARCCARASPAIEVLDRAAEASEFERVRARTAAERGRREPGGRHGRPAGIGLALAWHGAGFTGSRRGRSWARSRASSCTARRPDPGPDRRRPRWARARRRSSRSSSRPSWASTSTTWRWRRRTRRSCPTAGRRSPRAPRWSSAGSSSRRRGG